MKAHLTNSRFVEALEGRRMMSGDRFEAFGDFNGDRVDDKARLGPDAISVLLKGKDGSDTVGATLNFTTRINSIRVTDFDGDSNLDILPGTSKTPKFFWAGNGDGTFDLVTLSKRKG